MNPIFSIIIPHKGIPDLLMRCLKSIPVSEDIQVIVVDDNSADADTYLERYPELSRPYLEFIPTTKGGGAGYARNVGLDRAKGKWILFADADDFFVEDMYDIICSYVDSDADVIYFKKKSVLSEDTSKEIERCSYVNNNIDKYLADGDEWPLRVRMNAPHCKMAKGSLFAKYGIRFDETICFEDYYCSMLIGFYAETIKVVNRVLYVITSRPDSLSTLISKPELFELRVTQIFRRDKFLFQNGICREHDRLKELLWKMLRQDRELFKYYFYKLDEIYPSRFAALNDIRKGHSTVNQIKLYLYAFWLWLGR